MTSALNNSIRNQTNVVLYGLEPVSLQELSALRTLTADFEFRVIFLLDGLLISVRKPRLAYYFTHS